MLLAPSCPGKSAKRVFALDVPGIHVLQHLREGRRGWPGTSPARHDDLKNFAEEDRGTTAYAASAALAFSAIAWNAAGSAMARSDSTLRSTVMPDLARPLMKTL